MAEQAEFSDIGDSVMHVEQLLKEHKKLEGEGQVWLFVPFLWTGKKVPVDSDRSWPLINCEKVAKRHRIAQILFSDSTPTLRSPGNYAH